MNILTIRNAMIKRASYIGLAKTAAYKWYTTPQYTDKVPADITVPKGTFTDPKDRPATYTIGDKDKGFEIVGKKFGVSPKRLEAANPEIKSTAFRAGKTVLNIPASDRAWIVQQYGYDPEWDPSLSAEDRGRLRWGETSNKANQINDGAYGNYQIRQKLLDDVKKWDSRFKSYTINDMLDPVKAEQVLKAAWDMKRHNWNYAPATNFGDGTDYTGHTAYGRRRFYREWNQGSFLDKDDNGWNKRQSDADWYLNNRIYSDEATSNYQKAREWLPTNEYSIVGGDTLSGIAKKHGITLDDLLFYNPGVFKTSIIKPNQKLNIPYNPTLN